MQALNAHPLAVAAAMAVATTLFAAWRQQRHSRRRDPDAVGVIDWLTVQAGGLIALGAIALFALRAR